MPRPHPTPYPQFAEKKAALETMEKEFLASANPELTQLVQQAKNIKHSFIRTFMCYEHDSRDESDYLVAALVSGNQNFLDTAREHLTRVIMSDKGCEWGSRPSAEEMCQAHQQEIIGYITTALNQSPTLRELESSRWVHGVVTAKPGIYDREFIAEVKESMDKLTMHHIAEGTGHPMDPKFAERIAIRKGIEEQLSTHRQ